MNYVYSLIGFTIAATMFILILIFVLKFLKKMSLFLFLNTYIDRCEVDVVPNVAIGFCRARAEGPAYSERGRKI